MTSRDGGPGAEPRCLEPKAREVSGGQGAEPRCLEPKAREEKRGYLLVALAATGWGTWPLVLRHAPMPAELQSTFLLLVLSLSGLPLMLRDRVKVRARPVHWLGVAWLGVANGSSVALFFSAYQRTSVAIAVLTHYLAPIFVALAAPLALGERPGRRTGLAIAVAFAGLVLLLQPWRTDLGRSDLVGAALGAASAVFYASNILVNKRLAHVFSASELMFFHGFVAVPLVWAFVPGGAVAAAPRSAFVVIFAAALGIGALCGLMFAWGLRRIEASHASVLTLLEPFVAVLTAALFLGQTIGIVALAGGGLILAAAVAVVTGASANEVDSRTP